MIESFIIDIKQKNKSREAITENFLQIFLSIRTYTLRIYKPIPQGQMPVGLANFSGPTLRCPISILRHLKITGAIPYQIKK